MTNYVEETLLQRFPLLADAIRERSDAGDSISLIWGIAPKDWSVLRRTHGASLAAQEPYTETYSLWSIQDGRSAWSRQCMGTGTGDRYGQRWLHLQRLALNRYAWSEPIESALVDGMIVERLQAGASQHQPIVSISVRHEPYQLELMPYDVCSGSKRDHSSGIKLCLDICHTERIWWVSGRLQIGELLGNGWSKDEIVNAMSFLGPVPVYPILPLPLNTLSRLDEKLDKKFRFSDADATGLSRKSLKQYADLAVTRSLVHPSDVLDKADDQQIRESLQRNRYAGFLGPFWASGIGFFDVRDSIDDLLLRYAQEPEIQGSIAFVYHCLISKPDYYRHRTLQTPHVRWVSAKTALLRVAPTE